MSEIIIHQGYLLKEYVRLNATAKGVSALLGISRDHMYRLYGQERLDTEYIDALKKNKIVIYGITGDVNKATKVRDYINEDEAPYGNDKVAMLEKLIVAKDETIGVLKLALSKK